VKSGTVLALLAGLLLLGQGWAIAASRLSAPLAERIDLPEVTGWYRVDYAPALAWEPRAEGAGHRLLGRYADGQGHSVDVFVAVWARQEEGSEAGGFGQGALVPGGVWAWQADLPAPPDGKAESLLGKGAVERTADTWYRTGDVLTGSNVRLKLANIADRLLLRERTTMVLILSAERVPGNPEPAATLAAFRSAMGPVGPWMDRVGSGR
jgi:EpsI family protein